MKRQDLLKRLHAAGCVLHREGKGHSIWINLATRVRTAVPRHRELDEHTARAILKQLGVPDE